MAQTVTAGRWLRWWWLWWSAVAGDNRLDHMSSKFMRKISSRSLPRLRPLLLGHSGPAAVDTPVMIMIVMPICRTVSCCPIGNHQPSLSKVVQLADPLTSLIGGGRDVAWRRQRRGIARKSTNNFSVVYDADIGQRVAKTRHTINGNSIAFHLAIVKIGVGWLQKWINYM